MNTIIRTLSLWLFASVLLLAAPIAKAGTPDEGMWLPMFVERLNYVDMQKMGLNFKHQGTVHYRQNVEIPGF